IRTTGEHPFWVRGRGWVACAELRAGDLLSGHDGRWLAVEDLLDTGEYETVYNLRAADFHTYFVGCDGWGFSVWAHNTCTPQEAAKAIKELRELRQAPGINHRWRAAIDQEIAYYETFVRSNFVEVQHVTPGRGSKPAVTRTVYKNTTDFDGG